MIFFTDLNSTKQPPTSPVCGQIELLDLEVHDLNPLVHVQYRAVQACIEIVRADSRLILLLPQIAHHILSIARNQ